MIKFFRNIRKKIISENTSILWNTKYIKYAVGEIFLVTIGIFLAIQANKWKENKAQDKLEVKLLKEVQRGIINDQQDVNSTLNHKVGLKEMYRSQKKCIQLIKDNELDISIDSLTYYFSLSFKSTTFEITTAPFDALKEFGLNNLSNDSLKVEMQALYDVDYPLYRSVLNFYNDLLDLAFVKGENYFEDWSLFGKKMRPYNIKTLKKDRPFLFSLARLRSVTLISIEVSQRLYKKQSKILEMHNIELLSHNE